MLIDYGSFKKQILAMTGIDLNAYKEKQMRRRIDALITKYKVNDYDEFVALLKRDKEVYETFIGYLTINVSEFYRNPDQWKYMDEVVIPELIRKFGTRLRIWSAACSTGDEPYSLVMALSRHIPLDQIMITATDIDKQILAKAKVGLYAEKSLATVPDDFKKKYFEKIGESYKIKDEIKNRVVFKQHNLLADTFPKEQHMIVCRNVLIYFTEEAKAEVFQKFCHSLMPQGVLFIGNTEQIISYKEMGYERKNSFFYSRVR